MLVGGEEEAEQFHSSFITSTTASSPVFFFKPGETKGLRNVLERHSVDFALSKARSLCFLSGTLTDAGCPSAPGYVYPEVEQAQQALHRLHL